MKNTALSVFLAACVFSGSALADKSKCFSMIHAAMEKDEAFLEGAADRLDQALDQTTVSEQSVSYLEASMLAKSAENVSLRLQILWLTATLAMAQENDQPRLRRTLESLSTISQSNFKIFALQVKLADIHISNISDRQLRLAAMDVALGLKKLDSFYQPCRE